MGFQYENLSTYKKFKKKLLIGFVVLNGNATD